MTKSRSLKDCAISACKDTFVIEKYLLRKILKKNRIKNDLQKIDIYGILKRAFIFLYKGV